MPVIKARTEFARALNQICAERGIELKAVLDSIKIAILAAYKKDFGLEEEFEYFVDLDPETGATKILGHPQDKPKEKKEITPPDFGRIAAQTARQVILQKIREAEKAAIINEYKKRIGTLVNVRILRFDGPNIICDIGRDQGLMPLSEQVKNDDYRLNQRLTVYILDIQETKKGEQVIVSRSHKGLVESLFRREVPEVASGAAEIKVIAREAGNRSKVAVFSDKAGVDPVGSCVGQKGVRVQAVINELNGEKIDIIQWNEDPAKFIAAALSPAENIKVQLNEKKKVALVTISEDQLSLAIGKDGQNVRLAAKLTGWKIDIKSGKQRVIEEESELDKLGLKKKVRNLLIKAGITKAEELEEKQGELSKIKGLGSKSIEEIKELFKK
ncbi:transcription termination/antitermination protein NusA [Candidatus Microgenomates bacterium]|nr:transcription termination/antitermination protein NusA [Candidatus Microgenomates bacterium]